MIDWQPIETAPKDGTRILLFVPIIHEAPLVACGYWETDCYAKYPKPYWTNDAEGILGRTNTRHFQPTHWAKLTLPKGGSDRD